MSQLAVTSIHTCAAAIKHFVCIQYDSEVKELKLEIERLKRKLDEADKGRRQAYCDSAQQNRDKKSLLAELETARSNEREAVSNLEKQIRSAKKAESRARQAEEALQAEARSARESAAEAQSQLNRIRTEFNEYQGLYGQVRALRNGKKIMSKCLRQHSQLSGSPLCVQFHRFKFELFALYCN